MAFDPDVLALVVAVFLAAAVEVTEAFTIVLAMGLSRGWRSALTGAVAALLVLAAVTAVAGITLREFVNAALLQLVIGTLLLVFGLQWLRKAILRSAGIEALHDEEAIFAEEFEMGRAAGTRERHFGLDPVGFVISFKGVLLEGIEVVFIVITFGIGAAHRGTLDAMWIASLGAVAAAAVVVVAGIVARRPLAMVPENAMKYAVGLLLSSFGLFWVVEGVGYFGPDGKSLDWPGGTWALAAILLGWLAASRLTIALSRTVSTYRPDVSPPPAAPEKS